MEGIFFWLAHLRPDQIEELRQRTGAMSAYRPKRLVEIYKIDKLRSFPTKSSCQSEEKSASQETCQERNGTKKRRTKFEVSLNTTGADRKWIILCLYVSAA